MGAWAPQIPLLLPRHQITEFTLGLLILVLGIGAVGAMLFTGRLIERLRVARRAAGLHWQLCRLLPLVVLRPISACAGAVHGCWAH